MLEDRSYMRQPRFGAQSSATIWLVVANVLAFIAQLVLTHYWTRVNYFLPLSLDGLRHGYVWQLVSFQFMHAGFLHLFFNCLVIYMFGRPVEDALGTKNFLILYFLSGIIGGLCQILAGILLKGIFAAPVVGASAGGFGLTSAFALLFPDQIILLFFVLPLRAKYFLWLSIALAVYGILFPSQNPAGPSIAEAAHLGGIIVGVVFVKYAVHWHWQWPQLRRPRPKTIRTLVKVPSQKAGLWGRSREEYEEELPPQEFLSKEVDPILDKISAQGIQSLTDRERRILEKARSKMGKR
jgi:membrane associated rhomboid family serine protease